MKTRRFVRKQITTRRTRAIGFVACLLAASLANAMPIEVSFSGSLAPTDEGTCESITDPAHLCGAFSGFFSIDPDEVSLHPGELFGVQLSNVRPLLDSSLSISGRTASADPVVGGTIFDNDDTGSGIFDRFQVSFSIPIQDDFTSPLGSALIRLNWLLPTTSWDSLTDISGFRSTLLALDTVTTSKVAICQGCDGTFRLFAGSFAFETSAHPVAEPGSLGLFGAGWLALVLMRRRRRVWAPDLLSRSNHSHHGQVQMLAPSEIGPWRRPR